MAADVLDNGPSWSALSNAIEDLGIVDEITDPLDTVEEPIVAELEANVGVLEDEVADLMNEAVPAGHKVRDITPSGQVLTPVTDDQDDKLAWIEVTTASKAPSALITGKTRCTGSKKSKGLGKKVTGKSTKKK